MGVCNIVAYQLEIVIAYVADFQIGCGFRADWDCDDDAQLHKLYLKDKVQYSGLRPAFGDMY